MEVASSSSTNTNAEEGQKSCFEVNPHWDVIVHCGNMEIKCVSVTLKMHSEYFNHVIGEMTSLDEGIFLEEEVSI